MTKRREDVLVLFHYLFYRKLCEEREEGEKVEDDYVRNR